MSRRSRLESVPKGKVAIFAGLFAAAIVVSSSTVVPSRTFIHAVGTAIPGLVSEEGFRRFWESWWWLFVKGWHATEFGLVFLLLRNVWRSAPAWLLAALATLFAASDEIHQLAVPQRGAHVSDWLVDSMGVGCAWIIASWWRARKEGNAPMGNRYLRGAAIAVGILGVLAALKFLGDHPF